MFSGKRPTDDIFRDGLNLHNFSKMALPEKVMKIVDPRLLNEEQFDEGLNNKVTQTDDKARLHECLATVLKVGVACSVDLPKERMDIKDVRAWAAG
ncbi:hypothetical protein GIB67_027436 [Kingdonia uniflora]|uniref:Uncharacterized protein n=1 Tax=Kingdonia uniflora TaxID=39325 RepID=A0A7J7MF67_9MAGN|nr:hypothetical protein GIB67_027436 [Kingdonia uniflora]